MSNYVDVAIIGAGPYGLSLAAHLGARVRYRVFGPPMGTWRRHMPPGMCLKSDGFACDLYDPERRFTLKEFCRSKGLPYQDRGMPVPLETFTAYGVAFQQRFVRNLDERAVAEVSQDQRAFWLKLEDGDIFRATNVVLAVGLTQFAALPEMVSQLSRRFVSHTSQCEDLGRLQGREVVVLGAGASAVDTALALHDVGARPTLLTRRDCVPFHGKAPEHRSLLTRMKTPWSGLGPGWRSRLACSLPLVFQRLPRELRFRIVQKHLGPAPGWFTSERFLANVPCRVGLKLTGAAVVNERLVLQCSDAAGVRQDITTDHLIAGTGYHVDVNRLSLLCDTLRRQLRTEGNFPVLSSHFESSVPGLYMIGPVAAHSFGPLLRFAFGAKFTAVQVSRRLGVRTKKGERKVKGSRNSLESSPASSDAELTLVTGGARRSTFVTNDSSPNRIT